MYDERVTKKTRKDRKKRILEDRLIMMPLFFFSLFLFCVLFDLSPSFSHLLRVFLLKHGCHINPLIFICFFLVVFDVTESTQWMKGRKKPIRAGGNGQLTVLSLLQNKSRRDFHYRASLRINLWCRFVRRVRKNKKRKKQCRERWYILWGK